MRNILQGQVYVCDFGEDNIDSEQNGIRPSLIISVNALNESSANVVVFPITSKMKKVQPFHKILRQKKYSFLKYEVNTVLCENIRSISKSRVNQFLGSIDEDDLADILKLKEYVFTKIH